MGCTECLGSLLQGSLGKGEHVHGREGAEKWGTKGRTMRTRKSREQGWEGVLRVREEISAVQCFEVETKSGDLF